MLGRRRVLVLVLWAVALVAAVPLAAHQTDRLTGGGVSATDSPSAAVERAIATDFPGIRRAVLAVVLVPAPGARPRDLTDALARVWREVGRVHDAAVVPAGRRAALASVAADPARPVIVPLRIQRDEMHAIDLGRDLRAALGIKLDRAGSAADGRVDLHVVGQGALWAAFQESAKRDAAEAEAKAFPAIAIVLLVVFGALAAAALPLALGVSVGVLSGAVIYLLSLATEMSVFVTNIASMIGIGVAIDYSLFVLARYREAIRAGRTEGQARAEALATSGVAVAFSGLTVIVSLAGLFLIGSQALSSIAIGAMVVVAVAVLGATTLVPALIAVLGRRAYEPGRVGRMLERRRKTRPPAEGFWARWTSTVMSHPVLAVVASVAVLLALAAPALDLRLGNSGLRQLDGEHEFVQGSNAVASVAGPGVLSPVRAQVRLARGRVDDPANRATLQRLVAALERDSAVRRVNAVRASRDGRSALLTAILRTDPESQVARDTIERLRERLPQVAGPAARVEIGGTTATITDFDELVTSSMWKIIAFVLAMSFVVLTLVLRSIVLPLKAVLMNVLSLAAAYGVIVAVFQWGWLEFLGLEQTPFVDTVTPPLVLVVAFGLSSDYELFLLSRIRERYLATGDTRRAVAEGLASSGRVITSAALVLVIVFIAFVASGAPSVQRLGVGCAAAIAIDATIVRLVLVPATMQLLGRWNWWLPGPLASVLPAVDREHLRSEPA